MRISLTCRCVVALIALISTACHQAAKRDEGGQLSCSDAATDSQTYGTQVADYRVVDNPSAAHSNAANVACYAPREFSIADMFRH